MFTSRQGAPSLDDLWEQNPLKCVPHIFEQMIILGDKRYFILEVCRLKILLYRRFAFCDIHLNKKKNSCGLNNLNLN